MKARGFTLIEMLLVVALLAATAMVSMAVVGGRDQLLRQQTSERRLDAIVEAVTGPAAPAWGGERRLAGFVADNGRLPLSVLELTARASLVDAAECSGASASVGAGLLPCLRARAPVFDPTPGADGLNNGSGDEQLLSEPGEALVKGLRRQLDGQHGSDVLRDGWGNVSIAGSDDDTLNHGWQLALPAAATEAWTIASLGSNNAVDTSPPTPDDEAVADLSRSIAPDDWSVDLVGWTVRVRNATGAYFPSAPGQPTVPLPVHMGVSLLVWESASGATRWRRFTTPISLVAIAPGDSADFSFAAPTGVGTLRIPNGEHRVLLVTGTNTVVHDADDTPYLHDSHRIHAAARFYPRAARPVLELVIR
ncbi:type II secretion system protein [Rubrivivax gelatinosus]|uniref:Prepilin-type N-terminal cleavage/methylation domain-containing protein n=1 Tax=Rubrivivax gelatinosus TaxID=28068 RepID=A0ABS1E4W8_RUBGE|nr:prepilin-type N-terminal cleavage/methylation domain-containing protein [Rubrivivax gelatinosus]MBK1715997.1 hypothetical protein [Rubrivivax gelatinosus]